jgi:hypothetical protein
MTTSAHSVRAFLGVGESLTCPAPLTCSVGEGSGVRVAGPKEHLG